MKNIHVVQTDKPSRLFNYKGEFGLAKGFQNGTDVIVNQNIYITSDEEIKEGVNQWYLDKVLNEPYNSGGAQYSSKQDVIILTTDLDLIKDGVQAIEDEFLEWFVKNPTCEYVDVKEKQHFEADKSKRQNPLNGVYYSYKIIIPKKEIKSIKAKIEDFVENCRENHLDRLLPKEEPNQETLEEVAKKYIGFPLDKDMDEEQRYFNPNVKKYDAFIEGAKWQQEQDKKMYSEEVKQFKNK